MGVDYHIIIAAGIILVKRGRLGRRVNTRHIAPGAAALLLGFDTNEWSMANGMHYHE